MDEYSGLVWAVIRSCGLYGAEAADVSQTVWLRFVEHIGRLRQPERAGAWLATTARHECFRVLRRPGRQVVTADVPEVAARTRRRGRRCGSSRPTTAARDRGARWAPAEMPGAAAVDGHRAELTYDEIAETLGVRRGWIGPTRGRCIDRLRRAMGGLGEARAAARAMPG